MTGGNVERETEEPNPTTTPLHNFTLTSPISAAVADGGDIVAGRHNLTTDFPAAAGNVKLTILEHTGEIKKPSEEDSKPRKKKFPIALSRAEIEADFAAIPCPIPPRKPKKRPRARHRENDNLFPACGRWRSPPMNINFKKIMLINQGVRVEDYAEARGVKVKF